MSSLDLHRVPSAPAPRLPLGTLLGLLDATIERHPGRVAIDAPDGRLTYAELDAKTRALADRLRSEHVGRGDRVGVRVPSGTAELYVAILGVLRAGAAYVPVDADEPPARAQVVWDSCGACAVIGQGLEITPRVPAGGVDTAPGSDSDAWIIFTSGSTGAPKGVAVTHGAAAAFVQAETELWTVTEHDRVLAGLSVAFDASCEEMWLAWANGAALVPAPRAVVRSGADLGPWLADHEVTVVSTVPTLAALWDDAALAGVRLLILGGEALSDELGWRLAEGREVWNTYGPTEATVVTTATRVLPGRPVTIGRPLGGWLVAVVDEDGEQVAAGETGELVIGGVGLARYLDPDLDAARFAPLPSLGWPRAYRSGDLVRDTPDGLAFGGRRDHQVKLGGRRIELGEIDAQLAAVPGVRAATAVVQRTNEGNQLLVGYVVGDVTPDAVRAAAAPHLPGGLSPIVVVLDELPLATSGKVDRRALPWPPPRPLDSAVELTATEAWLAERWADQLGPQAFGPDSDFFAAGGSSVAVAKLVSVVRGRFPSTAVRDVYDHRTLRQLAARLDALGEATAPSDELAAGGHRRWGLVRLFGLFLLFALTGGEWLVGLLGLGNLTGSGPQLGWVWLVPAWLLVASPMSRSFVALAGRWLLLGRLEPGRYPRNSWLSCRVWFMERLADACRVGRLAGTPWAARYGRLTGARVGAGARLGTIPQLGALVEIGAGATIEAEVDMNGWWLDGGELVVGRVSIGAHARIGARVVLMPGTVIGAGAEIEPGSVVDGEVPAGERWAGSPARRVGLAGEAWPAEPAPTPNGRLRNAALFGGGLFAHSLLPLLPLAAVFGLYSLLGLSVPSLQSSLAEILLSSMIIASFYLASYALLVAGVVRLTGRLLRPGWQAENATTGWALWFTGGVLETARAVLFPLMCSIYTRSWLRLSGVRIGRRTEISTVVGLNRLVSFGERSFAADDVVMNVARARDGWLYVAPIRVGDDTFLGNGAMLDPGTEIGNGCLVGVLSTAPLRCPDGTSWLGAPAIELPRVPQAVDPRRTTNPPRRLIAGRASMDLLRILMPGTVSTALGLTVFFLLQAIGAAAGLLVMVLSTPFLLVAAGLFATVLTVALKWLVMGRYGIGEHPLWSFFVWRDELINSAQEQLSGAWLMSNAIGTPLMSAYLRALGSKVGSDVWVGTLALTEFDLVELRDGVSVDRRACVETHLFHDRLLSTGPATLEEGAALGPGSAILPDTRLGEGCVVGARSVVLRGEELPAHTHWQGVPVVGR